MSRRAAHVAQADIARALRAAEQAGTQWEVRIEKDGTIRILPVEIGGSQASATAQVEPEEEIIL